MTNFIDPNALHSMETEFNRQEKVYCFCKKPDDGNFMIQCDLCLEWFHGNCVNIPKAIGQTMTNYTCPYCTKTSDCGSVTTDSRATDAKKPISDIERKRKSVAKNLKLLADTFTQGKSFPKSSLEVAKQIEKELKNYKSPTSAEYSSIARMLLLNLKGNACILESVFSDSLSAHDLVRMKSEEFAPEEIKKQAELIRKQSLHQAVIHEDTGPRIKKTHKGLEYEGVLNKVTSTDVEQSKPIKVSEGIDAVLDRMTTISPVEQMNVPEVDVNVPMMQVEQGDEDDEKHELPDFWSGYIDAPPEIPDCGFDATASLLSSPDMPTPSLPQKLCIKGRIEPNSAKSYINRLLNSSFKNFIVIGIKGCNPQWSQHYRERNRCAVIGVDAPWKDLYIFSKEEIKWIEAIECEGDLLCFDMFGVGVLGKEERKREREGERREMRKREKVEEVVQEERKVVQVDLNALLTPSLASLLQGNQEDTCLQDALDALKDFD